MESSTGEDDFLKAWALRGTGCIQRQRVILRFISQEIFHPGAAKSWPPLHHIEQLCKASYFPGRRPGRWYLLGHAELESDERCAFAYTQALLAQDCRFLSQATVSGLAQRPARRVLVVNAASRSSAISCPDRFTLMAFGKRRIPF